MRVEKTWNNEVMSFNGDIDFMRAWFNRKESIGMKSNQKALNKMLLKEVSPLDPVRIIEVVTLLLSKGADPNYCEQNEKSESCVIFSLLSYSRNVKDYQEVLEKLIEHGGKIRTTRKKYIDNIEEDCEFSAATENDDIFNYVFTIYLKNKPTKKIVDCSAKSLINSANLTPKQIISRMNYLLDHDLDPNSYVAGLIELYIDEKYGYYTSYAPILFHIVYQSWRLKSDKKDFYKLVSRFIDQGAEVNQSPLPLTNTTLMSIVQKGGDSELYQIINAKLKK